MTYIPRHETQRDQAAPLPWTNCTFASGAMLIDHWTYGRTRTNDMELRTASGIPVRLGANFAALRRSILERMPGLDLRYSEPDGSGNANLTWAQLRDRLAEGGGAAVAGSYAALAPHRSDAGLSLTRWQPGGRFGHAMFAVDYRPADQTVLLMDSLGHGGYRGDRAPLVALWEFIYKTSAADANVRVAAAWSFAGKRPAATPAPAPGPTDHAGTVSAFGTRYPSYVHADADALAWVNRNIRRLRDAGKI